MSNRQQSPLLIDDLDPDPIKQFTLWLQAAEQAGVPMANAMTLATASLKGQPSARVVLLKGVDERGFVFYTNYKSRKALELQENPLAALVFCWLPLSRQVRVEGTVERLEPAASDLYFASRPRGGQIEAYASPQSRVIKDRPSLDELFEKAAQKYAGQNVPRPHFWGGYRIIPVLLEFWQEGDFRLHDRLCYRRSDDGPWVIERLAP